MSDMEMEVDEEDSKPRSPAGKLLVPLLERLDETTLCQNITSYRFQKMVNIVLENVDPDFLECDRESSTPSHLIIAQAQLEDLCSEAAKLKSLRAMENMPTENIARLLALLEINIRDGCRVTPEVDLNDSGPDEGHLFRLELMMETVMRGVTACGTALHILTSPNMSKRTYVEDLIDGIVVFTKFQLQNTVYPAFDPVYKVQRGQKNESPSTKKKVAETKEILSLYTRLHEIVSLLSDLLDIQALTDNAVLHLSNLGVSTFFVENVPELQLGALKLVTWIFTHYEKHRRLILQDILASIARLPTSKRNLRTFKLGVGSEQCIQMLTALVLQLIQSVPHLPYKLGTGKCPRQADSEEDGLADQKTLVEWDVLISNRFDTAVGIAGKFLAVFLSKCGRKSEDCDYKQLFEHFLQDLLSTVNKPEWPAAELLLSLLGNILVKNLGDKRLDVPMRVASLEYLGVAAARLRKDSVSALGKMDQMDRIISNILAEEERFGDLRREAVDLNCEENKVELFQWLLLDYLSTSGSQDFTSSQARHFYIASWWKTAQMEVERSLKQSLAASKQKKYKKIKTSSQECNESDEDEDQETDISTRIVHLVERRKKFLLSKIRPDNSTRSCIKMEVVGTFVDPPSAELLARYLASKRPFSASFDYFLTRILSVAAEQTVAIRTKALRCLTMITEADPNVLARQDMQLWVRHSFLDQSAAVREAAVDLVGKYITSCPDLIEKYYDILCLRILDTGVSVRKRVIRVLRDICVGHPSFPKISEICVRMIGRVNDEDGIRKLVLDVFQNMWLTPVRANPCLDSQTLHRKVINITEVVALCDNMGLDFFEQLFLQIFKSKDERESDGENGKSRESPKVISTASMQIVNYLVEHVLSLEEISNVQNTSFSAERFSACIATLYMFARVKPQLLVNHASTLGAYLTVRCHTNAEVKTIVNIAATLELVVPLMVNPAESFLTQLEEDCVKLIFRNYRDVIESCVACLGAVVNKITRNYSLVRDLFRKFHSILQTQIGMLSTDPCGLKSVDLPRLRRAIYTMGLVLRYFDFTNQEVYSDLPMTVVNIIFFELFFLVDQPAMDLQFFGLQAIGNACVRHSDFMLGDKVKGLYNRLLASWTETRLKKQVLHNLLLYLTEEERRMIKKEQNWQKHSKVEDIKELDDVASGMSSTIVQIYMKEILASYLHPDVSVRTAAFRLILTILQQGLVHPLQIVPSLICMSTDTETGISNVADKKLKEIGKKHPNFVQSLVLNGIKLSLRFHQVLSGYENHVNEIVPVVRGYKVRPKEAPEALHGFLYSLARTPKPQRRSVALCLLKQFDDQNKVGLGDLLYYADSLAYFPYQIIDEPLFVIHHVDVLVSVLGSNQLQAFQEALLPVQNGTAEVPMEIDGQDDEDEEEDVEGLLKRMPEDTSALENCMKGFQGCVLLLMLKQHLKDMYGITDTRIANYSPSDMSKTFERPIATRKNPKLFDPQCTLAYLKSPQRKIKKSSLAKQYLAFKELMLRIDPPEEDEEKGL